MLSGERAAVTSGFWPRYSAQHHFQRTARKQSAATVCRDRQRYGPLTKQTALIKTRVHSHEFEITHIRSSAKVVPLASVQHKGLAPQSPRSRRRSSNLRGASAKALQGLITELFVPGTDSNRPWMTSSGGKTTLRRCSWRYRSVQKAAPRPTRILTSQRSSQLLTFLPDLIVAIRKLAKAALKLHE